MLPCMMIDNSLAIWSWLSAALLALLSATLTLSPRLLLFLSESGLSLTPLEAFLALHFGIFLAALALTLVLNACTLQLSSSCYSHPCQVPSPKPPLPSDDEVPSHPLLTPLTIAANISAFLAWNTMDVGSLASIVFFISITIGLWGLWTACVNKFLLLRFCANLVVHRLFSQILVLFQNQQVRTSTRLPSSLAIRLLLRPRKRGSGEEEDRLQFVEPQYIILY